MKRIISGLLILFGYHLTQGQDWDGIVVPADPGEGHIWELQTAPSDDFNYSFEAADIQTNFGSDKWYNFYHNNWDGPGTTYWQYDHVSVDGSNLLITSSRNPSTSKMGVPGVNAGCITSNHKVQYPVYVEASVSVANITLASDVWLLSPDDTQEIDIIECYGGAENGNSFFSKFIHLSHHSFIRDPFTDYQPRDINSWWDKPGVTSWGQYSWNDGDRKYVQVGVNWISPFHFEYYIDGELVRVLYDKAFASKNNETWSYTYPTMTEGELDFENGYQKVITFSTSSTYSFQTLQEASETSTTSVIDPYNYQNGNGFTKEMDIIINVESQDWHVEAGRTPTDAELADPARNTMKVDWLRVYKPIEGEIHVTDVNVLPTTISTGIDQKRLLTVEVLPFDASNKEIVWSSSNESIVTVDQDGWLTGKASGIATIYATNSHGEGNIDVIGTSEVTVQNDVFEVPVESISVNPSSGNLLVDGELQLSATILPIDATDPTVTWTSADISITTVDENGLLKAIGPGEVIITATAVGGLTAESTINVSNDPIIWINPESLKSTVYVVGDVIEMSCTFDAGGSTINTEGVKFWLREITENWGIVNDIIEFDVSVAGLSNGTANASISTAGLPATEDLSSGNFYFLFITFTDAEGNFKEAPGLYPIQLVNPEVTDISISPTTGSIEIGETLSVSAIVTPSNASQEVTWSTSDEGIAIVSQSGLITGISKGQATITATSANSSITATTVVTVTETITSIENQSDLQISIYPNPAHSYLYIKSSTWLNQVSVISLTGNEMMTTSLAGKIVKLDTRGLLKGLYIVRLYTEEGDFINKKLVIE
ncbi:MAG: Ig-like domain-containing protein [Reichenbachiella sp.]